MTLLVYTFTNVVLFFVVIKYTYKVVDMSLHIQTDTVHQGKEILPTGRETMVTGIQRWLVTATTIWK